jgi:carbon monoxide dehydrogenase subunit G
MEIKNNFEVPLPPDEAWALLMDIPRIVPCMPGAELVEMVDDRTFKGTVAVKLGPVALVFKGTAQFEERDDQAHAARASARGTDTKGRGGANATVTFNLAPSGTGSRVDVVTDITLSGSVAQYGRGTSIIQSVATQLVNQFAASLRSMLAQSEAAAPFASNQTAPLRSTGPAATSSVPVSASMPVKPIGGFTLMLKVLKDAIVGFFKKKVEHD